MRGHFRISALKHFRIQYLLYFPHMWPFHFKKKPPLSALKKVIAGVIIGGAIGSIIGKTLMDHTKEEDENDDPKTGKEDLEESDEE